MTPCPSSSADRELGALGQAQNWAATPLGPPETWPASLRAAASMVLNSKFPACIVWGPELITIHNEAFRPILGAKPQALGRRFDQVWTEAWDTLRPVVERVLAGEAIFMDDFPVTVERHGYLEQAFFTFCYSPLYDEAGRVAGFLDTVLETTEKVLAERRQTFLLRLEEDLRGLVDLQRVTLTAAEALGRHLGAARVGYGEINTAGTTVRVDRDWGNGTIASLAGEVRPLDGFGPAAIAELRAGQSLVVEDCLADSRTLGDDYAATWASIGARALVVVPLLREGRLTAILFVHEPVARRWRDTEVKLVEDTARRTWEIFERARAEEAVRDREERLRVIVESARDYAIFTTDPQDRIDTWMPGAVNVFGWSAEEALGRYSAMLYTPEDRAAGIPMQEVEIAGREGAAPNVRWHVRKDGSRVFIEGSRTALRHPDGRLRGFLKIGQDVSERKAAEAALRESEARFRHMADSAPALIWMTDAEGQVVFANMHHDHLFGRPAAAVLGQNWESVLLPEDRASFRSAFKRAFLARQPFRAEARVNDKTGKVRWLRCEGVPRTDDQGTFLGYTGCNVDITEARKLADELERRVSERTAELMAAEETLRQAQKMEAVGQLTGGIAHDFNNMLQGITSSLDMAELRVATGHVELVAPHLETAREAADRAAGLTRRLLAFARRQRLEPRQVRVNELILGMADLIQRTVTPEIGLQLRLRDDVGGVLCDANELESALLNLCINARDAMPEGGRLTISAADACLSAADLTAEDELAAGEYVEIAVADTGTGMSPEVLRRAVEPFFTTKPLGQGTGLGLSQVYGFVRQSGGLVRLESEQGQGTVVRLLLPKHTSVERAEGAVAPSVPDMTCTGGKVLLVDDEAALRIPAAEWLREHGYQVLEASNGPAALRLLEDGNGIDLLITDVGLPNGMNGRQVAEAVREHVPGVPVLFITGYAATPLPPGSKVIGKPFQLSVLVERVRSILARESPG
ncbi:PAS domain S-box protein [Teichococcus oryzae]|uniref:histidine kinase n=1 Tax=Teichococcus oryzae TaxID=1608942 RepID=A0A5B2T9A8_9PROT|nr:PAS domain S-box protein [Pseudoroseomonas oryzae]KAA2211247.1 PAS domain S-box protein [Pseudoroseomonas oryzae]